MRTLKVSRWDTKTSRQVTEVVNGEVAIAKLAAEMLEQSLGSRTTLPGFELSCDDESWGQLAVAVAPFGWALVHTSQDYVTQHCSQNHTHPSEESVEVQWDEITTIPRRWFIDEGQAMEGIRQWMQDGKLANTLPWSDQCF